MNQQRQLIESREIFRKQVQQTDDEHMIGATMDRSTNINDDALQALWQKQYKLTKFISFGHISKVVEVNKDGRPFAAKIIQLSTLSAQLKELLDYELNVLPFLNHPYVIKYEDHILFGDYLIIITEYSKDGSLLKFILNQESDYEPDLKQIKTWFHYMLTAVEYVHSKGYTLGDITIQDFVLCNNIPKLNDFSYAQLSLDRMSKRILYSQKRSQRFYYMAPEQFNHNESDPFAGDAFSMGILLYNLITLNFPFQIKNSLNCETGRKELLDKLNKKDWIVTNEIYDNEHLLSLLAQLLNPDPLERASVEVALKHSYFNDIKTK